jgi:AAA+ ATPase superfamily predicted ATPase
VRIVPNPYTNRSAIKVPEQFFGRDAELTDIFTRIQGGQSVLLMGERRIGKSSLLYAVGNERKDALQEDTHFVLLDMQSVAGCTEDAFIRMFCREVAAVTPARTGEQGRDALNDLALKIRATGRRLIIAVDEFDVLVSNERIMPEFLAFLRSWTLRYDFPFVVAFRDGSIARIVEDPKFGSAFLNQFGPVYVGPLKQEEARRLVREPAAERGVQFSREEIDLVLDLGGYFPLLLQIVCYQLFELRKSGQHVADLERWLGAKFRFEAEPHIEYLWRHLPDQERRAVREWVQVGGTSNAAAQNELLKKGVLVEDRHALRLFSRAFPDLIERWRRPQSSSTLQHIKDALLS